MRRSIVFALAITLLAACSTKEIDFQTPVQDDVVFYASFEQPGDEGTRVYANEDLLLRWTADDRVSIFNKNTYNQQYQFIGETGDYEGGFNKIGDPEFITGDPIPDIVSVYPFQRLTRVSPDETVTVTLPSEQAYAQNSFGLGANTMVSVSSDNLLKFRNVGGYLMLKLYGEGVSVRSITLKGNNGEKLAGTASITMPLNGIPSVEMASDATTEITLRCATPVQLGATEEESTQFWFVVPPVTFSKGFTITVRESVGYIEKSTTKTLTIERNKLSKMSPIDVPTPSPRQLDSLALVAIYNASDGDNWTKNNWDLTKPLDEWKAVTLTDGRVTALKLTTSGVIAKEWTLPAEIGDLAELTDLRICSNKLTGEIPESLYGLEKLEKLYFQNDNLTGSLSADIAKLTNLTELYVDRNANMTGTIPPEIGTLKKLARINISQTGIGGEIPVELGQCDALLQFMAFKTKLSGNLPDIWDMPVLQTVMLHSNPGITGPLPASLSKLKSLENGTAPSIQIYSCNLTGSIPASFANLPEKTKQVYVNDNKMTGTIPAAVAAHPNFSTWRWDPQQDGYGLTIAPGISIPEAVDMGLSIKWASFNLGASKPEEYGDYYAWGETEPHYISQNPLTWKEGKVGYGWSSYRWCNGFSNMLTKYCDNESLGYNGFTDGKTVLDLEDDAAHVALGGNWRMPTDTEWTELIDNCNWSWTQENGVYGKRGTSRINGNTIFFPAAGIRSDSEVGSPGSRGYCWSSSRESWSCVGGWCMNFDSSSMDWRYLYRYYGLSIRPVYAE